jgi:hypothetical protein
MDEQHEVLDPGSRARALLGSLLSPGVRGMQEEGALRLPLLAQSQEEIREGSEGGAAAGAAGGPGDIEQGQLAPSEHGTDDSKGPEAALTRVSGRFHKGTQPCTAVQFPTPAAPSPAYP